MTLTQEPRSAAPKPPVRNARGLRLGLVLAGVLAVIWGVQGWHDARTTIDLTPYAEDAITEARDNGQQVSYLDADSSFMDRSVRQAEVLERHEPGNELLESVFDAAVLFASVRHSDGLDPSELNCYHFPVRRDGELTAVARFCFGADRPGELDLWSTMVSLEQRHR